MKFFVLLSFFVILISSCASKSPEESYKDAIDLYNKGMYEKAENSLQQFSTDFKGDKNYPNALFLRGFILANNLNQMDSAKSVYNYFLKRYPNHELVPSVKFELQNLGKSPDLLLEITNEKTDSAK